MSYALGFLRALTLAATAVALHAQSAGSSLPGIPDDGPQCNPGGNQGEMNACAARDFKAADAALNKTYQEVIVSLPQQKAKALRAQQRAWLKRRDPQCKEEAKDSEGGSIWPLEYLSCLQGLTEERTKEVQAWAIK